MLTTPEVRSLRKGARAPSPGNILVRIDRQDPVLGNPFILKNANDMDARLRCIEQYTAWVETELKNENSMLAKRLKMLAKDVAHEKKLTFMCWCDPLPCHGHVLSRLVVELAKTMEPGKPDYGTAHVR